MSFLQRYGIRITDIFTIIADGKVFLICFSEITNRLRVGSPRDGFFNHIHTYFLCIGFTNCRAICTELKDLVLFVSEKGHFGPPSPLGLPVSAKFA